MRKWRLSHYTQAIRNPDTGEILLHNSFMGAIARVPIDVESDIGNLLLPAFDKYRPISSVEFDEPNENNPTLRELCTGGFFVPSDVDERRSVSEIIAKERESGFGIIILPHENCNFRCVYCYEEFKRGKMRPDVIAGLKAFVDTKAKEIKILTIGWFGGEPLLAKDIIYELSDHFIDSCDQNGIPYTSGMTTNGYFLTSDVVDALLQRKVIHYQVTLDGPEASHNNTRKLAGGRGTYRRILENLIGMGDTTAEFSVTIRVNFNNANVPLMEELLYELGPLFENDPRFNLDFHPVGKWGGPNDSVLDVCDAESAQTVKHALVQRSLTYGFSGKILKEYLMPHGNVCYAGKETSIVVGSDGTIYKCTVAFEDPRNHVGKLTKDGKLEINQDRWDLWTKVNDKNTDKCNACSFSPSCQSRSCPLVAINQKEPPCPYTKADYQSMVKLTALAIMAEH